MLTAIDPKQLKTKPSKYEVARNELKADIQRAIDEHIADFELSYDGMRPEWIKEKAEWVSRNILFERPEFLVEEAKTPGLHVRRRLMGSIGRSSELTAVIRKGNDGKRHVYCHIDFDMIEANAKKAIIDAHESLERQKQREARRENCG